MKGKFADFLQSKVRQFYSSPGETGRVSRDATQRRFARQVGVPYPTLSRILNERNNPSYETLRKLVRSPEVGSEALTALDILPEGTDPRIIEIMNRYYRGELTREQIELMIDIARRISPDEEGVVIRP